MFYRRRYVFFLLLLVFLSGCQNPSANPPPEKTAILHPVQIPATLTQPPAPKPESSATPPAATHTPTASPTVNLPASMNTSTPDKSALAGDIEKIIGRFGGRWHIVIKEVGGETLYTRQPDERINIASVVKVPLALLLFAAFEEKGLDDEHLAAYLQSTGTGGRTFDQLLRAMLVKSEEDATQILDDYLRSFYNIPAQLEQWQLSGIDLVARRYTAAGVAEIFERLYQGDFVSPAARSLILGYLGEYTPNDDLRLGVLSELMPPEYKIYNKRGSLLTPYVVADCAILENPQGADYIIILFAYQGDPKTTYEALEQAQAEIARAFWQAIDPAR